MSDEKKDTEAEPLTADRARQIILARRARFVAAALAGIGAVGCDSSGPGVCLSIERAEDSGTLPGADAGKRTDAGPRVCLSIMPGDAGLVQDGGPRVCLSPLLPQDAGRSDAGDAGAAGDAGDASGIDAGPQVCLSIVKLRSNPDDPEVES